MSVKNVAKNILWATLYWNSCKTNILGNIMFGDIVKPMLLAILVSVMAGAEIEIGPAN